MGTLVGMDPTLTDLIDLLGAVAADLDDVAVRLQHAPQGLDPSEALQIELASATTGVDPFARRIGDVLQAVADSICRDL